MIALILASGAVLLGAGTPAGAAPITWGPPITIKGDADVDTTGTLVGALNLGLPTTNTTVNGVPFTGLSLTFVQSSGPFSFSVSGFGFFGESSSGSTNSPFSALSPSYQTLLGAGSGTMGFPTAPPFLLTITGLTVGDTYEFEWWTNLSFGTQPRVMAAAVNSVVLSSNTTGTDGGVGQFAIGRFTADATSEAITFSGVSGVSPVLNGLQLRDLGPAAAPVPEPTTVALFAVGLGGLALNRWRRARAATPRGYPLPCPVRGSPKPPRSYFRPARPTRDAAA
jgi:hypothetical protein